MKGLKHIDVFFFGPTYRFRVKTTTEMACLQAFSKLNNYELSHDFFRNFALEFSQQRI